MLRQRRFALAPHIVLIRGEPYSSVWVSRMDGSGRKLNEHVTATAAELQAGSRCVNVHTPLFQPPKFTPCSGGRRCIFAHGLYAPLSYQTVTERDVLCVCDFPKYILQFVYFEGGYLRLLRPPLAGETPPKRNTPLVNGSVGAHRRRVQRVCLENTA